MPLTTLITVDLASLSKRDLKALCTTARNEWGQPFDLRGSVTAMISYLEQYKQWKIEQAAEIETVTEKTEVTILENQEIEIVSDKGTEPALNAPALVDFDGIDYQAMLHTNWQTSVPISCDPCNFQYCHLPEPETRSLATLTEIMARPMPVITAETQRELDELEELFVTCNHPEPTPESDVQDLLTITCNHPEITEATEQYLCMVGCDPDDFESESDAIAFLSTHARWTQDSQIVITDHPKLKPQSALQDSQIVTTDHPKPEKIGLIILIAIAILLDLLVKAISITAQYLTYRNARTFAQMATANLRQPRPRPLGFKRA